MLTKALMKRMQKAVPSLNWRDVNLVQEERDKIPHVDRTAKDTWLLNKARSAKQM